MGAVKIVQQCYCNQLKSLLGIETLTAAQMDRNKGELQSTKIPIRD